MSRVDYKKRPDLLQTTSVWSAVVRQHDRGQFDAISTRRILSGWKRGDDGDGSRRSQRA